MEEAAAKPDSNEIQKSDTVQKIDEKCVQLEKELKAQTIANELKDKLALEAKKEFKKRKREEEAENLLPWQKGDPDFNPVLKHKKMKKQKTEILSDPIWKQLEENRQKLKDLVEGNINEKQLKALKEFLNFDDLDIIIASIKTKILSSWRLGLLNFVTSRMLKLVGIEKKDIDEEAWKAFIDIMNNTCTLIDKSIISE